MSKKDSIIGTKNVLRNSLVAGSVAGMASTVVCYPFDVLRVKMQTRALETARSGLMDTFKFTIQHGGLRALYTGLVLPLGAQAIYKGTVFSVNNMTEQTIIEWKTQQNYKRGKFDTHELTLTDRFVSGFMGGAVNAALFVTPVEYIRNRQINEQGSQRVNGPISVIKRTLQSDGMVGLWRGTMSTILRDSVGCGCFFVAMSYSQKLLSPNNKQPSGMVVVSSGAIAGVSFWLWALPIDTMKTWIQNGTAKNLRHAFRIALNQGFTKGLHTLSRGWQVSYGRGAPSAAITVTTYQFTYQFLTQMEY